MSKRLMLVAVTAMSAATACSSGGGNVQGGNSLNPTPQPIGVTAAPATPVGTTPTATPTAGGTTPTATPTGTAPTATPTPVGTTPTATPTSGGTTPTSTPSPSPTPTATSTSGGTTLTCTTSSASPAAMTYTFTGGQQMISLPTYNNFVGTSEIPYNNEPNGTVKVTVSQNNFDNAPTSTSSHPAYASRTKDFFSTLVLGQTTTFYNDSAKTNTTNVPITITETSPCIMPGTTYYVDLFALGSSQDENSAVATMASNGEGTVTGPFHVTVNPFTGGLTADVILSH